MMDIPGIKPVHQISKPEPGERYYKFRIPCEGCGKKINVDHQLRQYCKGCRGYKK